MISALVPAEAAGNGRHRLLGQHRPWCQEGLQLQYLQYLKGKYSPGYVRPHISHAGWPGVFPGWLACWALPGDPAVPPSPFEGDEL